MRHNTLVDMDIGARSVMTICVGISLSLMTHLPSSPSSSITSACPRPLLMIPSFSPSLSLLTEKSLQAQILDGL